MNTLKRIFLAIAGLFVLTHTLQAHYDPNIGRWISRDPIAEAGGKGIKTLQIIDGPGANALTKNATWYVEICAYCCHNTPQQRLLGCTRFNFDNRSRKVTPKQAIDEEYSTGWKLPAYDTESNHFDAGWKDWSWK